MSEKSKFSDSFCGWVLQKKIWCHRAGGVMKYTLGTVSRPRRYFSGVVYAVNPPNLKDPVVRRNLKRMS